MAESYRGLTIKIGGDATGLQKALRTATQASAGAAQEIRKLKDATKMDPGNVQAYTMQMGYMAEQAANTSMKLYQMREAAQQLAGEKIDIDKNLAQPVEELVKSMRQAHTEAAKAKTAYVEVTDSLAEMHTTLSRYNREMSEAAKVELGNITERMGISSAEKDFRRLKEEVRGVFADFDGVIEEPKKGLDELFRRMTKLREEFKAAEKDSEKGKITKEYKKLLDIITDVSSVKISFAEGTTDFGDIDRALKSLSKLDFDEGALETFRENLARMKSEYSDAMETLKKANEKARLADLNVEIVKAQASIKSVARAIADMKAPSDVLRGMYELTERTKALDEAYRSLVQRGSSLESAFSINPENTEAQAAAMSAFASAEQVAEERAEALREQLSHYDTESIDAYADKTKSAAQQVNEATLVHQHAIEAVDRYRGAIDATKDTLARLAAQAPKVAQVIDEMIGGANGMGLNEAMKYDTANAEAQAEALRRLGEYLEKVADEEERAGDSDAAKESRERAESFNMLSEAYQNLYRAEQMEREASTDEQRAKQRQEVERLRAELASAIGDVDAMRVAQQKLAAGEIKPHVDTTEMDRLREVQKDLSDFGSTVGKEFAETANDIKVLTSVTDDATERAKALVDAYSRDPSNLDAASLAMNQLAESTMGAQIRANKLAEIIEAYADVDLDQVAIATDTIGLNAERAAQRVKLAMDAVADAQREADELAQKYKDAVGSAAGSTGGAENANVAAMREQYEAALQKLRELEEEADRAEKALDMANATKEVKQYREELAKAENTIRTNAEAAAELAKKMAVSNEFGSTKEIDATVAALNVAVERAKAFKAALEAKPGNAEFLAEKTKAYADVARLAKQATDELAASIAGYDTSKLDELREKYGTIENAVEQTTQEYVSLEVEVRKAEAALDELLEGTGMEAMREDVIECAELFDDRLTPEIREAVKEVNNLREAQEKAADAMEDAASAQAYQGTRQRMADVASSSAPDAVTVDDAAFMQALDRMADAAMQAGQEIVESTNTIDSAYRDMRKTVEGTEEDFVAIRDAAIEFSQTHAITADTLLEMEALGGQLGITTEKLESGKTALQEYGEVASNLDIATDMSAEDIALKLGQITNIMSDLDFSTFENFGDALVRLGNNVPATESAIMDVAQRIAAVANVTSMTTPELLGWSGAIASTGMHAESAATSISKTIVGIGQAVAEGGNKLEGFASIANMTSDEFKDAWENSSSDALEAFVKGLADLEEPSTAAIEALDSVGIKSVRQETALLALSQTIGTLDDSARMASDAFNGIDDEFGKAGDAAREAQNKSEGFSGALQIMQNNAAALAQTFGESLVGPMQVITDVLRLLTDVLNALPAPMKTAITLSGGALVAVSAIVPLLEIMGKGIGSVIKNLANSSSIGEFTIKLLGLEDALKALGMTTADAASALSGLNLLKLGGIALAVTAVVALVDAIGKAIEEYKAYNAACDNLDQANRRLVEAAKGAAASQDDLKESIEAVAVTAADATQFINELADKQNALAEQFERQNLELKVDADTAMEAFDRVKELMAKAGEGVKLNPFDQAELESAVAVLNDTLGSNIEVVDASRAAIKGMGDEGLMTAEKLRKMVDEQVEAAKRQVLIQQYVEAQQHMLEVEKALDEARQNSAENETAYADAMKATGSLYEGSIVPATRDAIDANLGYVNASNTALQSQKYLNTEVSKAEETYNEAKVAVDELRDQLYSLGADSDVAANSTEGLAINLYNAMKKSEDMRSVLRNMGEDLTDENFSAIAEDFANAGVSTETFASLTAAQLATVMSEYNGTASSVRRALEEMGVALGDAADDADEGLDRLTEAAQATAEQYEQVKNAYDHLYTEQRRIRDDYYDSEKKRLDKAVDDVKDAFEKDYTWAKRYYDDRYTEYDKELQREYDDLKESNEKKYDEQKDSLSKQYDEAKKSYDATYKLRKDEYDREYKALKDSLDKEYDERKKALDREYDAYKSHLDKQYDIRKKELDKEYDAVKEQLDAVQEARKKELDKEYKDAQKASQKYLKQYKKQLDAQVDAFKKATDERVKAIESERDAQKALVDEQTKAKTDDIDRRIAALKGETEAEQKAMEMQERAEKTAELQKAVDTAKSRRKRAEAEKALSDYLAELAVADAKEQRELLIDQLEDEKDALEEEADARKSMLDERYASEVDQYKAMRELQLEALQESLDEEYERVQESESQKLEMLKESHTQMLEAMKSEQASQLELIKEAHTSELEGLKEDNAALLQAMKDDHDAQLQTIKDDHESSLESMKSDHETRLQTLKDENDTNLEVMKADHEAQLEVTKKEQEQALANLKATQDILRENRKRDYEDILTSLKDDQEAQVEALQEANETQLLALKRGHEDELENIKNGYDETLRALKAGTISYEEVITELTGKADQGIADTTASATDSIAKTTDSADEHVGGLNEKIKAHLGKIDGTLKEAAQKLAATWGGGVDTIPTKTGEKLDETKTTADTKLEEIRGLVGTKSESVGNAWSPDFKTPIERGVGEAKGAIDKWGENDGKTSAKGAADTTTKAWGDNLKVADKTDEAMRDANKKLTDGFDVGKGEVEKGTKGVTDATENGLKDVPEKGRSAFSGLFKAMLEVADEYNRNEIPTVGGNTSAGLAQGMLDRKGEVANAAITLANEIVSNLVSSLETHSPSRVTTELGEYVSQGLAEGIENDSDMAARAAMALASMAIRGYEGVIDGHGFADDMLTSLEDGLHDQAMDTAKVAMEYGHMTGVGFMDELSRAIRNGEAEVIERMGNMAKRMSDALRDGFDASDVISDAQEAIGQIQVASRNRQVEVMSAVPQYQGRGDISVSVNLSGVTISNDMDVDRLMERIGQRMGQITRAKVGR